MLEDFAKIVKPNSPESSLLAAIDFACLPQHVAVIMDGNGRWAKERGKPRIFGHQAGVESVRSIVDTGARLGLRSLTLYAFSTENWKRPEDEVGALMKLLKYYLRKEINELNRQKIKFQPIGRIARLDKSVRDELAWATEKTQNNDGMRLNIALNYGGRAEIVDACRNAVAELLATGKSLDDLSEENIEQHLYSQEFSDIDLLIRTSGEFRISNFLLWQLAYSEIYVTNTLFPDFRRQDFFEAVLDYQKRDRRFGGISGK